MAEEFAPKLQSNPTNFTGRSAGPIADRSFEILFEGLGNSLAGAASAYDSKIQTDIRKEADKGFDQLNSDFGFEPLTVKTDGEGVPTEIRTAKENLSRLQRARDQGKLTDTAYYSRLVSNVKSLKARYPGYEEQVDTIIMDVTGTRPANALRTAMLSELEAERAEREQSSRDMDRFIDQNADILSIIEPGIFTNRASYSEAQVNELQGRVAQVKGEYYKGQVQLQNLNLDSAMHGQNQRRAETLATNVSTTFVNEAISGLGNLVEIPGSSGNVYDMMAKASTGQIDIDPEEIQQLKGAIVTRRAQLAQQLRTDLTKNGADILGAEKINKIVENSLAPLDQITSFLDAGEFDLAGMAARSTQTLTERDGWSLLSKSGAARQINALSALPPEVREHIGNQSGLYSRVATDLTGPVIASIIGGENTLTNTLSQLEGNDNLSASDKNGTAKFVLETAVETLKGADLDTAAYRNFVLGIYDLNPPEGQSIFELTQDEDQMTVFNMLTDPDITQKIMESGDDKVKAQYYNWATTQFSRIQAFRNMSQDVSTINETRQFMEATVDDKGRIVAQVNEEAFNQWAENASAKQKAVMSTAVRRTQKHIDILNSSFNNLRPIIEGVGGNPTEAMGNILASNFVDLDAREDSWGMWIAENIRGVDELLFGSGESGSKETPADKVQEDVIKPLGQWLTETAPNWVTSNIRSETFLNDQDYYGSARVDSPIGRAIDKRKADQAAEEINFIFSPGQYAEEFQTGNTVPENLTAPASGPITGPLEKFKDMDSPYDVASKFVGLSESEHANVIGDFISKAAGININPAKTAWCAGFVNAALGAKGVSGTGRLNARSFLEFGTPTDRPTQGDIVVFSRGDPNGWQGHVGFFVREEGDRIFVLGGNQGDKVSIQSYPKSRLLGYRKPPTLG